jgi:type II secretory pathway pseudopilin PulG
MGKQRFYFEARTSLGRSPQPPKRALAGYTLIEIVVAAAVLVIIGAIVISTDLVVSSNDRERYEQAAEGLADLALAIGGSDPTNTQTSFKWVIQRYPQTLSQLTQPITTSDRNICAQLYTSTFTARWSDAFWTKEFRTAGTTLAEGFDVQNNLGTFPVAGLGFYNSAGSAFQAAPTAGARTDGIISIRMPSVSLTDAQGLDATVDGTISGTAGILRYAATDPTTVDYLIMVSGC